MEKTNDRSYENGSKTRIMAAILGSPRGCSVPSIPNTLFPGTPYPSLPYTQLETGDCATKWGCPRGCSVCPIPNTPIPGTPCPCLPYTQLETGDCVNILGCPRGQLPIMMISRHIGSYLWTY